MTNFEKERNEASCCGPSCGSDGFSEGADWGRHWALNKDIVIHELVTALKNSIRKLILYRKDHSGEYLGGMEYQNLMDSNNEALAKYEETASE